jgi:hypothetical protein
MTTPQFPSSATETLTWLCQQNSWRAAIPRVDMPDHFVTDAAWTGCALDPIAGKPRLSLLTPRRA